MKHTSAEMMVRFVMNDQRLHGRVTRYIRYLRDSLDQAAGEMAAANAAWHDDPAADDHADHHAPAHKQYPRAMRDEAVLDLVKHYLGEITLQEYAEDDALLNDLGVDPEAT